jgi:hypothetical protein
MGRAVTLAFRGHQEVILENLALRQQLSDETDDQATAAPGAGPSVLDRVSSNLAELADGVGARHRRRRLGSTGVAITRKSS